MLFENNSFFNDDDDDNIISGIMHRTANNTNAGQNEENSKV